MPDPSARTGALRFGRVGLVLVLAAAAAVYAQYGCRGRLLRDDAMYLYSGQRMVDGVPPYVSIFDLKGPVAPLISGAGTAAARVLDTDDITTVRITFFIVGLLVVACVYLFARDLFASTRAGLLAAFVFPCFWGFGRHVLSGPRAKTPMVLFEVLALWLTTRRKWLWAGFFGSLAFLTWQPAVFLPAMTVLFAVVQSENASQRWKNPLKTLIGISLPLLAVSAYFLCMNAFGEFVDGTILFHLRHLERTGAGPLRNVANAFLALHKGYATSYLLIVIGLVAVGVLFAWRLKCHAGRVSSWVRRDPYAALILTFPVPVVLSLMDFQDYPDLYVFLPYAALGLGWLLHTTLAGLGDKAGLSRRSATTLFAAICLVLVGGAALDYHETATDELDQQEAWAAQIVSEFGDDVKVLSIGLPEALVLLHKTSPEPYIVINGGIDNYIDATVPGGFDGWVARLEQYDARIVLFGATQGKHVPRLMQWLEDRYVRRTVGGWTIYVRRPDPETEDVRR